MLFNSLPFLFAYLPLVIIGFYFLCHKHLIKAAKVWLLFSSLFFYGFWDVRFLPLLIGSILFNYAVGGQILRCNPIQKKTWLSIGILSDLALLFYFKYYNFFLSNVLTNGNELSEIILPLGISFFTFTQIAFLIDAYQQKAEQSDLISYGLFVTIFPHLIAGPILHHKPMLTQFKSLRMFVLHWPNISQGIFLFVLGLSKKVLIADNLSVYIKPVFDMELTSVTFIQAWFGAIAYTLQLYFDFSGYSDMAVGLGLLFNVYLPINFNSPYQADSIIDFWRRWHITLSTFLRDYLYIPLGGSFYGKWSKINNLLITMLLGGLWHGAGWTFIAWGACHGAFLAINHLWRDLKIQLPQWFCKALTLLAVIFAWVLFRSPDMTTALNILEGMVGMNGIVLPEKYVATLGFLKSFGVTFGYSLADSHISKFALGFVFSLCLFVLFLPNSTYWTAKFKKNPVRWAIPCTALMLFSILSLNELAEFLYYQF